MIQIGPIDTADVFYRVISQLPMRLDNTSMIAPQHLPRELMIVVPSKRGMLIIWNLVTAVHNCAVAFNFYQNHCQAPSRFFGILLRARHVDDYYYRILDYCVKNTTIHRPPPHRRDSTQAITEVSRRQSSHVPYFDRSVY